MQDMSRAVSSTAYPGRGIILGRTQDGASAFMAYFIMGRSENSRNRVFIADGDGLRTQAHDPVKLTDPSLILYAPVRVLGPHTIVTNGNQTDTIHDHLARGGTFEQALRTRSFEPDAPNFTPRISGLVTREGGAFSYALSILKANPADETACLRFFYEYEAPVPGQGHFLHTYAGDGNPLPPFTGEPEPVSLLGDLNALTDVLWQSLDPGNKVSLFTRTLSLLTGETATRIVNKHS